MGYETRFKLKARADLISEFRASCDYAEGALGDDGTPADSYKWYDHEEDLKRFSKKYPEELFELYGEGEEAGDLWFLYVKNGKSQRCMGKVVFDPFDESKLK